MAKMDTNTCTFQWRRTAKRIAYFEVVMSIVMILALVLTVSITGGIMSVYNNEKSKYHDTTSEAISFACTTFNLEPFDLLLFALIFIGLMLLYTPFYIRSTIFLIRGTCGATDAMDPHKALNETKVWLLIQKGFLVLQILSTPLIVGSLYYITKNKDEFPVGLLIQNQAVSFISGLIFRGFLLYAVGKYVNELVHACKLKTT